MSTKPATACCSSFTRNLERNEKISPGVAHNHSLRFLSGSTVRLLLVVDDPHAVFAGAVAAGTHEIRPVHQQYGWFLSRLAGKPLGPGVGE